MEEHFVEKVNEGGSEFGTQDNVSIKKLIICWIPGLLLVDSKIVRQNTIHLHF
jgi:hypothetical protein